MCACGNTRACALVRAYGRGEAQSERQKEAKHVEWSHWRRSRQPQYPAALPPPPRPSLATQASASQQPQAFCCRGAGTLVSQNTCQPAVSLSHPRATPSGHTKYGRIKRRGSLLFKFCAACIGKQYHSEGHFYSTRRELFCNCAVVRPLSEIATGWIQLFDPQESNLLEKPQ